MATRRAVLMGLAAAVSATALAACGTSQPAAPKIRTGIALTFMSSSSGPDSQTKAQYAAQFKDLHPGLTLEHLPITGGGNAAFYEKLQATLAAGTPPDVAYMHPEFLLSYTAKKLLRNMEPFVRRDKYDLSDFYKPAVDQYRVGADLFALPRGFAMEVLIYNVDLFQRAGVAPPPTDWKERTWDLNAFLDAARKLTSADSGQVGYQAANVPNAGGDVTAFHRTWVFVYAAGGAVLDSAGKKFVLADQPSIDGLQFLADLAHKHRVSSPPEGTGLTSFNNGKAAMTLVGAYGFSGLRAVSGLNWGAAVVPRGPGGRFSSGSGVGWMMPAQGANPEEAWLALQHVASKPVQEQEAQLGNVMPGRKSVAFGPSFVDPSRPPKDVKVFAEAGDYTHETPRAAKWPEIADVLAADMAPLWKGERSAKATLEIIRPKVEPLLKEGA